MKKKIPRNLVQYFASNLLTVIGVVLVWRGIWYLLDMIDDWFFGGHHLITAVGGIVLGLILLFVPDGDLKELEKL
jgi:uncharacterized membrane protein HdeD (DUF308 family)